MQDKITTSSVAKFKYMVTTLTNQNFICEEIKSRFCPQSLFFPFSINLVSHIEGGILADSVQYLYVEEDFWA